LLRRMLSPPRSRHCSSDQLAEKQSHDIMQLLLFQYMIYL
jgi:hypothetical protein